MGPQDLRCNDDQLPRNPADEGSCRVNRARRSGDTDRLLRFLRKARVVVEQLPLLGDDRRIGSRRLRRAGDNSDCEQRAD